MNPTQPEEFSTLPPEELLKDLDLYEVRCWKIAERIGSAIAAQHYKAEARKLEEMLNGQKACDLRNAKFAPPSAKHPYGIRRVKNDNDLMEDVVKKIYDLENPRPALKSVSQFREAMAAKKNAG